MSHLIQKRQNLDFDSKGKLSPENCFFKIVSNVPNARKRQQIKKL